MSVQSALNRTDLVGNGTQTLFSFSFPVYVLSDLQVYVGGVLKTLNADYTQSAVNVPGGTIGGSVTFSVAPGNTVPVILIREVPNTQTTSFTNLDKFDAKSAVEGSFDRGVMQVQQLAEILSRTLQLPITLTSYSNIIPDPTITGNQGQFLQIGATQIQAATPVVANFTNPLTVKGDLMGTITGPTPARVAVGTDTQILVADSTQNTGVKWTNTLVSPTINTPTISNPTISAPTITGAVTSSGLTGPLDLSNAAAGQIKFPASQNASANVNILDDYEEGTWTPSVGGNATYTLQSGNYTKIGNLVTVWCNLIINIKGTGSASTISGLPFSVGAGAAYVAANFVNAAATYVSLLAVINATTTITFRGLTAAAASYSAVSPMTDATQITFSASYQV